MCVNSGGSLEPSQVANVIRTVISCAGSNMRTDSVDSDQSGSAQFAIPSASFGCINEPQLDETNKMKCARQSLRSACASAKDPRFLHVDSEVCPG